MIYPVACFLAVAATLVRSMSLSPISGIFEQSGVALPCRRIVLQLVTSSNLLVYPLEGLAVFLFLRYRYWAGRYQLDQLKLKMPVVSWPMQKMPSLLVLPAPYSYQCGYPQAFIDSAAATTNNAVVIDKLRIANEGLQRGTPDRYANLDRSLPSNDAFDGQDWWGVWVSGVHAQ